MLDEEEFSRWMVSAKKTLESALGDLERGDYNWACFKAQQACEMAVKALMHGLGLPAYGHSASKLLVRLSSKKVSIPKNLIDQAKTLDKYYIPTRYPNAWSEGAPHEYYTESEGREAIKYAERIIEWVEDLWRSLRRELRRGGGS